MASMFAAVALLLRPVPPPSAVRLLDHHNRGAARCNHLRDPGLWAILAAAEENVERQSQHILLARRHVLASQRATALLVTSYEL